MQSLLVRTSARLARGSRIGRMRCNLPKETNYLTVAAEREFS